MKRRLAVCCEVQSVALRQGNSGGARAYQSISANQAGAPGIEFPARNQILHCGSIVSPAKPYFPVKLVCIFDLGHIGLHAETGRIGDSNSAADDLERLLRKALAVLPD